MYISSDIVQHINLRAVRWAEHVARIWEKKNVYRVSVGEI
jgi:hypothetical protein